MMDKLVLDVMNCIEDNPLFVAVELYNVLNEQDYSLLYLDLKLNQVEYYEGN